MSITLFYTSETNKKNNAIRKKIACSKGLHIGTGYQLGAQGRLGPSAPLCMASSVARASLKHDSWVPRAHVQRESQV